MNLLDVLFSREIKRRTGAHAISIYIDSVDSKKRSRTRGKKTIKASKNTKITTKKAKASLFRRLDIRFPWLKLAVACILGLIAILDLLDLTISKAGYSGPKLAVAPFSKHVRISEREFEGKKLVALTFDDGPSAETTPKLLDILYEKDAPSTFFMLGSRAENNPDIVKRIKKEGHDIASHTMYHQNLIRISSGAGGQHVNKTSSAIRITHLPTGIVVQCQNQRSQLQNKETAMQMLKAKLFMLKQQENAEKISDIRGDVKDNAWGSQIRSYVLQPYTLIKDHRTGYEAGNVSSVLDGAIDGFISAFLRWESLGRPQVKGGEIE